MTTELQLKLMDQTPNSTVSSLKHEGTHKFFIIEDGFHEIKIPGQTRIPGGRYLLRKKTDGKFFEKYSQKYGHKFVVEISSVPDFEAILIHIGNRSIDTRGCLLTNNDVSFDNEINEFIGVYSEIAYRKFYNFIEPLMDAGDVYLNVNR